MRSRYVTLAFLCGLTCGSAAYADDAVTSSPPIDSKLTEAEQKFMSQMPAGVLLMWHRTFLPEGWQLCDGQNGSPNMMNNYPEGTKEVSAAGKSDGGGGSATISGTTSDAASSNGDGWWDDIDEGDRTKTPQTTGLGHTHTFSATATLTAVRPPTTKLIFIMRCDSKTKCPGGPI